MFIPKGKAVHENLSTRYLLIDALVADLCEGGFSGVVELTLRDSDSRIIFDHGILSAVIEKPVGAEYSKTNLASLAKRAAGERGRVSLYGYPSGVAGSIAGRLAAESLYTNLSTEFADIEKLVLKLLRENDREWFVEVFTGGKETLIHIADEHYRIISSEALPEELMHYAVDKTAASPLHQLVDECQRAGGTFDVFFRPAKREAEPAVESATPAAPDEPVTDENVLEIDPPLAEASLPAAEAPELSSLMDAPEAAKESALSAEETGETETADEDEIDLVGETDDALMIDGLASSAIPEEALAGLTPETFEEVEPLALGHAANVDASLPQLTAVAAISESEVQDSTPRILPTRELMALPGNFEGMQEALQMADIRRMMGRIINIIEEVSRGIEQKDNFQMHLRAGQLKVANDYPFLDPFGSEFEYLDGEIVFIGKVEPEQFITGLTDALIFAVTDATQASAQPLRLRAFIAEELENLLDRNREEFARYHLDHAIKRIIGPQM